MNIRRVQVRVEGRAISLLLEAGFSSVPCRFSAALDPVTALALAGMLESAVHKTATTGLPLFATAEPEQPINPS